MWPSKTRPAHSLLHNLLAAEILIFATAKLIFRYRYIFVIIIFLCNGLKVSLYPL